MGVHRRQKPLWLRYVRTLFGVPLCTLTLYSCGCPHGSLCISKSIFLMLQFQWCCFDANLACLYDCVMLDGGNISCWRDSLRVWDFVDFSLSCCHCKHTQTKKGTIVMHLRMNIYIYIYLALIAVLRWRCVCDTCLAAYFLSLDFAISKDLIFVIIMRHGHHSQLGLYMFTNIHTHTTHKKNWW